MIDTKTKSSEKILNDTMTSGIYKIVNKINGKYYVGSTTNFNKRKSDHIKRLNGGYHINKHLQSSWNKYGKDNFEFVLVEFIEPITEKLLSVENKYLAIAKQQLNTTYNLTFDANGGVMSFDSRNKSSISKCGKKGKSPTIETRIKLSNANKGKPKSLEIRNKISNGLKGKIISIEVRKKISESRIRWFASHQ
jgi:group I intron endonuclease